MNEYFARTARDRGTSSVQYGAMVLLIAALITGLVASTLPTELGGHFTTAICRVFGGDCTGDGGTVANPAPRPAEDGEGGEGGTAAGDPGAQGDYGDPGAATRNPNLPPDEDEGLAAKIATSVLGFLGNVVVGIFSAFGDAVLGIFSLIRDLVVDPGQVVENIKAIGDDIPGFLRRLVVDDETVALWKKGEYGEAIGRVIFNGGTLVIGVFKLAKLGKAGQVGKAGQTGRALTRQGSQSLTKSTGKKAGDLGAAAGSGRALAEASKYRPPAKGTAEYNKLVDELSRDPAHLNRPVSPAQIREAEAILEAVEQGDVPGPVKRAELDNTDPAFQKDQGDYVDANGQAWDVKNAIDIYPDFGRKNPGQPMPPGQGYDRPTFEAKVDAELAKGENVVVDTKFASAATRQDVEELLNNRPDWKGKVVILK